MITLEKPLHDGGRTDDFPSIGGGEGIPLTVRLRLVSANSGRAITGRAVRLRHCDGSGDHSLGVQASTDTGWVSFAGLFPGADPGCWPHLHLEVCPTAEKASPADRPHVVQLAFPADVCETVYATEGYATSRANLSRAGLTAEHVLTDGWSLTMATVTGDVRRGFVATRTVTI